MSVQEISEEFLTIVEKVYQPQQSFSIGKNTETGECMEGVMQRKGLPIDMKFAEKSNPGDCSW